MLRIFRAARVLFGSWTQEGRKKGVETALKYHLPLRLPADRIAARFLPSTHCHFPAMLEFFRRHRGPFMIGLTAIIIVSFAYWGGSRKAGANPNAREAHDTAFTIYGRDYNMQAMAKIEKQMQLCYYFGLYELAFGLPSVAEELKSTERGGPNYDFIGNLLVLREIAVKNGVAVSDAEAKKKMETLRPFQKDNKFDEATAAELEERLKANGFTADDILQLVKDSITYERLQEIAGANYSPAKVLVEKSYASAQQTIKASTITLAIEDFKKKAEVKDDEITKYYNENKDTYMTPEKRAASYVVFETVKPDEKKKAEENVAAQKAVMDAASAFDAALRKDGASFDAVVAEMQKTNKIVKLQTLAAFDRAAPPEAIKDEAKVIGELFRPSLKVGAVSAAIDGTKGYYFMKVTQIEEPKQQELKDVKDKIKEVLVGQKAQEALLAAANDARTVLQDALKAGKKLDDVAKEKGWKVEALPEFSPSNPPAQPEGISKYAQLAGTTPAGGVTKPQTDDKGATLLIVTAKELRKSDQSAALKSSQESSLANQTKGEIFKAWFARERKAAAMTLALNK